MKRTILFLAVFGIVLAFGTVVYSASVTSSFLVSTEVLEVCTVSTVPVAFGNYDGSEITNTQGSVDVTCTAGVTYHIALDAGGNLDGIWRRMDDGIGNYLVYNIVEEATGSPWGDSDYAGTYLPGSSVEDTGDGTLQTHGINAYLDPGQFDIPTGPYTDVVNVTVNY